MILKQTQTLLTILQNRMLVKKYTPNWIKDFMDIKNEIENGLHGLDYTIEHIGSTSVPNLDSKPIIRH